MKGDFSRVLSEANGQALSEQASKVLCPSCAKHQRFDGRIQQEEQIRRWWKMTVNCCVRVEVIDGDKKCP